MNKKNQLKYAYGKHIYIHNVRAITFCVLPCINLLVILAVLAAN